MLMGIGQKIKNGFWRYRRPAGLLTAAFLLWYAFGLPRPLFDRPTCMVLEDRAGNLLGARIAADGQWRFPPVEAVPERFALAILTFEDRRFYYHPGVDPIGLGRALVQNIRAGRVVSGGSTLSMQVVRMARDNPPRTIWEKALEVVLATRLELGRSKSEILALYASHAPFGGNVVGLEAASWRYFGKRPADLSWAEAAMLAVLPNSPALIHPGRNRAGLLAKRNRLLRRLHERGVLDETTAELATAEPLPEAPHPLPRLAPHLLARAYQEQVQTGEVGVSRVSTTIDPAMQRRLQDIARRYHQLFRHNEIHNLALLIAEVESGAVRAYVGNAPGAGAEHGEQVDVIPARRSTGSILKPLLYAVALEEGTILPNALLPDVPTQISGYQPENFHEDYDGVTPAREALVRSLNIPMVHLLQRYGLEKFHFKLRQGGLSQVDRPASHYGLTLVLGGAEASLWDLCGLYGSMARILNHFYELNGAYDPGDLRPLHYLQGEGIPEPAPVDDAPPFLSAASVWHTFDAMEALERPDGEGNWERFRSGRRLAWKTGTSFGFRDAWAIGLTPRYVVGVWVGNADGEGRPGLVGVRTAAPVLFDVISGLPGGPWFLTPEDELTDLAVCRESGYLALPHCPVDTIRAPAAGKRAPACPYHQLIHLDATGDFRVNAACAPPPQMTHRSWFVLPPLEEHYYRKRHPGYASLPPLRADCPPDDGAPPMQLIYPKYPTRIYVPNDLGGRRSRTVFSVAHRRPATTIHWHVDEAYVGSTRQFHTLELNPEPGAHRLTLVDENGYRLEQRFEIVERK